MIGTVIINKYATLQELQTVYGLEDLMNMLECIKVDTVNQSLALRQER